MMLHPGRGNGNELYIRGGEREKNFTSGEGKGKCSYIRGGEREMKLHPGRGKENEARSGGKGNGETKWIEVRSEEEKRGIQLHPG